MDENFDPRKIARDSEIEGLDDAKGALAGEKQVRRAVFSDVSIRDDVEA